MKRLILPTVVISLLYGCSTPLSVEGVYRKQNVVHSFELYSDSTFIYKSVSMPGSSFVDKYSDGHWSRVNEHTIILNSRITKNIIPIRIEKINIEDSCIQVCESLIIDRNEYQSEDFLVTPYIDGVNYLDLHPELSDEPLRLTKRDILGLERDITNALEEAFITCPPVKRGSYCIDLEKSFNNLYFTIMKQPKTLSFSTYYVLQTEHIDVPIQAGELLNVKICLNDSLFSYRIFNNTELKIKGKTLIFKDSENNDKKYKLFLEK